MAHRTVVYWKSGLGTSPERMRSMAARVGVGNSEGSSPVVWRCEPTASFRRVGRDLGVRFRKCVKLGPAR
jgi:hypothetical protein